MEPPFFPLWFMRTFVPRIAIISSSIWRIAALFCLDDFGLDFESAFSFTIASAPRTDKFRSKIKCQSLFIPACVFMANMARPWPAVILLFLKLFFISGGNCNNRSALVIVERFLPTDIAMAVWAKPNSLWSTAYASASSIGFRFSR